MTGKGKLVSVPEARHSGDPLTQFLVEYLQGNTPEGTLDEVYHLVEASRKVALLKGEAAWTPYAERRSLLESAGVVLGGGPATLTEVGRCVFDTIRRPELLELLQVLGSPAAVYEALPNFLDLYAPAFKMSTEQIGPNECRRADTDAPAERAVPRALRVRARHGLHVAPTLRILGGRYQP